MSRRDANPIRDYCLGIFDGPHATPSESDIGPIFLGIKNITGDGHLDLSEIRHVSEEEYPRWTKRVIPQHGDVVLTYEATLHRYAVIPEGFRGCLGRRVALVRPDPRQLDSRYLLYFFLSATWRHIVEGNIITGATVDRLPLEKLPEFRVSFPRLDVQQRIADVLSSYDDLIENNRRRMTLLEEAAQELYHEWFVRRRFPGHEHTPIRNGIPEGWVPSHVADFGEVITGKTPSTKDTDNYGGDFPFIKTPDMHGKVFVITTEACLTEKGAGSQPSKLVPPNTLLVSCIGTVGVVALTSERSQFNQQINAVVPFDDCFRYYCLFAFRDLRNEMEAIGGGVTMANVSKARFETLKVMRPSMSLLKQFHEYSFPIFQQIHNLSLQNYKLRFLRDLLLPRLMSAHEPLYLKAAAS